METRTCIRCGTEMIEGGGGNGQFGLYFHPGSRQLPQYPVRAAVCPRCHEISLYMSDEDFDRMTGRKCKEVKL